MRMNWLGLKLGFIHCLGLNPIFGLDFVYFPYDLVIYSLVDSYIPTKTTEEPCQCIRGFLLVPIKMAIIGFIYVW